MVEIKDIKENNPNIRIVCCGAIFSNEFDLNMMDGQLLYRFNYQTLGNTTILRFLPKVELKGLGMTYFQAIPGDHTLFRQAAEDAFERVTRREIIHSEVEARGKHHLILYLRLQSRPSV